MWNLAILLFIIGFIMFIILNKDLFPKKILLPIITLGIFCWIPIGVEYFFIETFVKYESKVGWVKSDWAGFLGSYLGGAIGALITLVGVYWQIKRDDKLKNKEKIIGVLKGILYSLDKNLIADKKLSEEENKKILKEKMFQSFYFLDYYYDNTVYSVFYDTYIFEIFPEIIRENYKVIFEIDFGAEIIDLNNLIKELNKNHKFLIFQSKNIKNILKNIEEKALKIKRNFSDETEDIKKLSRLGTDYKKILEQIGKIKEASEEFSIQNIEVGNNKEILNKGIELHKFLDELWGLVACCDNKELKKNTDKLAQYLLAEGVLLSDHNNIFEVFEKIGDLKEKIVKEIEKIENN